MNRPSIALSMIVKNEAHNLPELFKSISGCFDAVYVTDTGSTDETLTFLKSALAQDLVKCPIFINHFEWINDFAKARQHSFNQVDKSFDFIMWLDADDSLGNRDAFLHFRDHTMHCADMWLIPYNYAFDANGMPTCVFLRERIVRNNFGFTWNFFLHEGIVADHSRRTRAQSISVFTVNHRRSSDDLKKDGGRNLKVFLANKLNPEFNHPRMQYYYGKELHDGARYLEAIEVLRRVITEQGKDLEPHDRIMAIQYLAMAYGACEKWPEALQMSLQGLQLSPERAEFWILAGDANLKMNRGHQAVPFYEGAKRGSHEALNGLTFTDPQARTIYPSNQLCHIYSITGAIDALEKEGQYLAQFNPEMGNNWVRQAQEIRRLASGPIEADLIQTDDLIITCPPEAFVTDWDEHTLANQGLGGSETACVEIARFIKQKTGRAVKIFQPRKTADVMPSGVEYLPIHKLKDYIFKYKPYAHLAWRHATKMTPAPTYVWSHDLITPGGDDFRKFDKYICLSGFHREFIKDVYALPDEKISVLSNGINPDDFSGQIVQRNPYKIIFSSSPDRGLERCIEITKRARELTGKPLELHIFYGFKNMRTAGYSLEADRLEKMIKDNDFVVFHGFVSKKDLVRHFMESACWLYPADFIETSCISAMEAMSAGCYSLVRNIGSLPYTLREAIDKGMATILDQNASCGEEWDIWAKELAKVIDEEKWRKVDISPLNYSWEKASEGFIQLMGL